MSSNLETVAMAAILTVLVSFPTVSQQIDYSGPSSSQSPVVSSEKDLDREISISDGEASKVTVERHDSIYTLREVPSKRIEVLETPSAEMRAELTENISMYTVDSPYGTLRKGMVNGRKVSKFKGANRSKVKSKLLSLKDEMERYRSMARQEMLPNIELRITESKTSDPDERVVIDNDETQSVNLNSWTLRNSDGDTYEFDSFEVPALGTVIVYTEPRSEINVTETGQNKYVYSTGTDWDSYSEEATLFNTRGVEVAEDRIE